MTPEQAEVALETLVHWARGRPEPDRFLERTGITDPTGWALAELDDAIERRCADDVALALLVAARFGEDERFLVPLVGLLGCDWHVTHEDIAFTLGELGSEDAVPALVRAAHHVPAHLDHDEGRSLAVKAIHALGSIRGDAAEAALLGLRRHEDRALRPRVERVLARRRADLA